MSRTSQEWCVHYTGLSGPGGVKKERCAAGVAYDSVRVNAAGIRESFPCLCPAVTTCSWQHFPTPEEIAVRDAENAKEIALAFEARETILAAQTYTGKRPPVPIRGTIECPKCKGALAYSISSYNGHIWGRCATPGCLTWME